MEKITDKIAALPKDANYFSLEFFPPKTAMGSSNLQTRLERMSRGLRPLFVTVTWGAGGSTATKSLELAEICQRQLGLTTCLHLTCTHMNRSLVDDALNEAKAIGVRNILALRGDPPRNDEYRDENLTSSTEGEGEFTWAIDLVRYIRKVHGDYFCVGVAAYPEGHADESYPESQNAAHDLPYLVEKVQAGADFIMTQLFYDVQAYQKFEALLRNHPSGLFKNLPIIPGLMPVQSYQILKRTTKLSHAKIPPDIEDRLNTVKKDDEVVKRAGVDIVSEIVEKIKEVESDGRPKGFHFYTLNLEKAVAFILERCSLIPPIEETPARIEDSAAPPTLQINGINGVLNQQRRRQSSVNSDPHNRVVVDSITAGVSRDTSVFEAPADEAGVPKEKINTRANTLAISEGEGSLGREATWDDFPNGRWGDARSPAYGEIDGYGPTLHVPPSSATRLWGHPTTSSDISSLFTSHIRGTLPSLPWSEDGLTPESAPILSHLLSLNARGWWTVASQPAVNGRPSSDPLFGWGPRNGFVFQKSFVELFVPAADWPKLQEKLKTLSGEISFYAANARGEYTSSAGEKAEVNAVTWGAFPGKEIVTPTIVEEVSFRAWAEEAFSIWEQWRRYYRKGTGSWEFLGKVREEVWLVNVISHVYVEGERLWDVLLEEWEDQKARIEA